MNIKYTCERPWRTELNLGGDWIVADAPLTFQEAIELYTNHTKRGLPCRLSKVRVPQPSLIRLPERYSDREYLRALLTRLYDRAYWHGANGRPQQSDSLLWKARIIATILTYEEAARG